MARRRIDASHVIAYQDGGHRHPRDGVVVTDGSDIIHVGPRGSWGQPVDETIDASGMVFARRGIAMERFARYLARGANVSRGDWAGRTIDELAPQTFPAFRG